MSATGDALGRSLWSTRKAAAAAFDILHKNNPTPDFFDSRQLAVAKAEGNVLVNVIEAVVQSGGHDATPEEVETVIIVTAVNLQAGQPVYVQQVSGQLGLASAAIYAQANVVGLAQSVAPAGSTTTVARILLELPDWTPVVGATNLQRGQRYFLGATPGRLTTTPPTTLGQSVVPIGLAISPTQLEIELEPPILL